MDLRAIEEVARQAAQRASDIQNQYYQQDHLEVQYKGEINLLTQADLASQEAIVDIINQAFPDHAILAEENDLGHSADMKGPLWVIDPLDGTTNFAHKLPIFGISIGYVENSQVQFGLIQVPRLAEVFTARRGGGAYLNGEAIHVSAKHEPLQSLLVTGFPYDRRESVNNYYDLFVHFEMNTVSVRRLGAASVDLAYVACGRFEGFWEAKLGPWDIAAGSLLIEEAGGKVTTYSGQPLTDLWCKEIVATNGAIHPWIVAQTQQHIPQ